MASGTISLGTNGYLTGQIVWSSTSNGTVANSSNVTATLQLRRTNSYTTTGTWTGSLSINGNSASYSYYSGISSSWVTVSSRTVTVPHNNDGTKVCTISGSGTGPSGTSLAGKTVSNSANVTLDRIPRQANILSAPNFNDEANPTVTFNNNGGFALNAKMEFAGQYIIKQNIPNTGTYTFNLTNEERGLLRTKCTGNSMSVRFTIATKINNSETYWSWLDRTMTMVNANPIFSNFDFDDINTTTYLLTGNSKKIIAGYSNVQVSINTTDKAEAQKNASMVKYRFTNGTQNVDIDYSDNATVTGTLNNVADGTNNVYAIDSRNNSTLVTKLANEVINYDAIYIDKQSTNVTRNNSNVGTGAILNLEGTFWNGNFGQVQNSIQTVSYRFKKTDSSTWITGTTPLTLTITDNAFSFNGLIASDNPNTSWDLESSYNIKINVADRLSINSIDLILNSAIPTLSLDKEGVGIMCAYDREIGGLLQVGGQKLTGSVLGVNFTTLQQVSGSTYISLDNSTIVNTGNELSIESNKIIIDENIKYILVNGLLNMNDSSSNHVLFTIRLRTTNGVVTIAEAEYSNNASMNTIAIPPKLVKINRASSIEVLVYSDISSNVSSGYITVQVVS